MAVVRSSFGGAASKAFQRIADIHDSPTRKFALFSQIALMVNFYYCRSAAYRAEFHAKIDLLSELKAKGLTKYFHGFLADETGRIRFVSFYPAKRERFVEYTKTGEAVCFRNVLIKRNKFGNEMEAEIQESSGLAKSPQKISVSTHLGQVPETPVPATLDEVGRFLPGQILDVKAKVMELTDVNITRTQMEVVKAAIADATGFATLTIWGADLVEKVELFKCYQFRVGLKTTSASEGHQLFTPRVGSVISPTDDLLSVKTVPFSLGEKPLTLKKAKIVSVGNFITVNKCPSCNKGDASSFEPLSEFCRCSSCGNLSLRESCEEQTKAVLTIKSQNIKLHLTADSKQMEVICNRPFDTIDKILLLRAPEFTIKYTADRRITAVLRPEQETAFTAATTENSSSANATITTTTAAAVAAASATTTATTATATATATASARRSLSKSFSDLQSHDHLDDHSNESLLNYRSSGTLDTSDGSAKNPKRRLSNEGNNAIVSALSKIPHT